MQSVGQMLMWLLLVLALIPLSLWLLKRSGMASQGLGAAVSSPVLRTVAQTSLGPGQRVVTVEVNAGGQKTWLVLGVTAQGMSTLTQMPAPAEPDPTAVQTAAASAPGFAQLLKLVQGNRVGSTEQKVG